MFQHVALEKIDGDLSLFPDGIVKRVVATAVTVLDVSAICH